jgi:hypothetical protein
MSGSDILRLLGEWYSEQCSGEWEHFYGIEITNADNPGWIVDIELRETSLEKRAFEKISIRKSEDDWLICQKKDSKFEGAGDPSKLGSILEHFLRFAGKL